MNYLAQRARGFGTTIFAEMTALAREHNAVNLGQGFPDFPAPDFIKTAAQAAIAAEANQYAPATGRPELRAAIADRMRRATGLAVDPDTQVVVTDGATEAIFATVLGLIDPGDEVILCEPYYDSYVPAVTMAGGVPRFVTLRPPDWALPRDALAALVTDRTKAILVNTPHNPIGKVYDADELGFIADLCRRHDLVAVVDEVYEHIVFDDAAHVSLAALPGMAERTVTISSIGKTFSVTGWKIGWAVAAPALVQATFRTHQFLTFSVATPLQLAAAEAMAAAETAGYYAELAASYQAKRDLLGGALRAAGLRPFTPRGTYFTMVDISDLGFADDVAFCRHLTTEVGVAAIPPSAFYSDPADGATLARFAFCKSDAALAEAAARLAAARLAAR